MACSDGGLQQGISAYNGSEVVESMTSSFASHFNASIVDSAMLQGLRRASSSRSSPDGGIEQFFALTSNSWFLLGR